MLTLQCYQFDLSLFEDFYSLLSMLQGIEKKTAKLQGSEKAVVARHEAGHAVVGTAVANLLTGQPRVEVISLYSWEYFFICLSLFLGRRRWGGEEGLPLFVGCEVLVKRCC